MERDPKIKKVADLAIAAPIKLNEGTRIIFNDILIIKAIKNIIMKMKETPSLDMKW